MGRRTQVAVGIVSILVLVGGVAAYFYLTRQPAAAGASANLVVYSGSAQVEHGSGPFSTAPTGTQLNGGDTVRTSAATKAAITYPSGSVTRLDSNTTATVVTLTKAQGTYQVDLKLTAGRTWSNVARLVGAATFKEEGPNSATAEVRGTTFSFSIDPITGVITVDNYLGRVIFTANASQVVLNTGQSSQQTSPTGTPTAPAPISAADLADQFAIFNIAADANQAATPGGAVASVSANNAIAVGDTTTLQPGATADGNSDLTFTLDWPGSTFELQVYDPDGVGYDNQSSDTHPFSLVVPKARAGGWGYKVHNVRSDKPSEQ